MFKRQPVTLIATAPVMSMAHCSSPTAHRLWIEDIFASALRYRNPDGHTVVVLPEHLTLPAGLLGPRGTAARRKRKLGSAVLALFQSYGPAIAYLSESLGATHAGVLLLAMTDTLWREVTVPLQEIARREGIYVSFCGTFAAQTRETTDQKLIAAFSVPGQTTARVPTSDVLENQSILIGPDGKILGHWPKCYLTQGDRKLGITAGNLDALNPVNTPFGPVIGTVCLDAFMHDYVTHVREKRTRIILQNSANPYLWGSNVPRADGQGTVWQPIDWLKAGARAVSGTVDPERMYAACSMMLGMLFKDLFFDGQPSIAYGSNGVKGNPCGFVGLNGQQASYASSMLVGEYSVPDVLSPRMKTSSLKRERAMIERNASRLLENPSLWKPSQAWLNIPGDV